MSESGALVLEEQMSVASARELETWEKVKGKYPGQPDHNEAQWAAWLAAAEQLRQLRQILREGPKLQEPACP